MTVHCVLDPARATAFAATLGQPRDFASGMALPAFWHLLYFWEPEPPVNLGRDGHPRTGRTIPETGLPRRMWAAGELTVHQPLRAGIPATRETRIEAVTRKSGRSGPLAFVRLRHDIRQRHALALTESQELVYRPDRQPDDSLPQHSQAPGGAEEARPFTADSTLLFRTSALMFNGHRIHHDLDYARDVEGYPGLVTHGPLLAILLAGLAESSLGALSHMRFRATAPLIAGEPARLCRSGHRLWVSGPDNRLCLEAFVRPQ